MDYTSFSPNSWLPIEDEVTPNIIERGHFQ